MADAIFTNLKAAFVEATVALNSFEIEHAREPESDESASDAEWHRLREVESQLEGELGASRFDIKARLKIMLRAKTVVQREKWQAGKTPEDFQRIRHSLYAKSFLFAIDRISMLLAAMERLPCSRVEVAKAAATFKANVPDLRGVRNSSAHIDERIQGIGGNRKPLTLQPVNEPEIQAPLGGVFLSEAFLNRRFSSTMGDGHLGTVEVSPETLEHAREAIQSCIDVFTWHGFPEYIPK
jgi:hypothetical protein